MLSLKLAKYKKAKIYLVCTPNDKIKKKIALKNKVSKIYNSNKDYVKQILNDTNQEGIDLQLILLEELKKHFKTQLL